MKKLLTLAFFLTSMSAFSQMRNCYVVAVHDGDTFTVNIGGLKINCRIGAIDCPELTQPWGTQSRDSLSKYILNKMVIVQFLNTDTYGRKVVNVWVSGLPQRLDYVIVGRGWGWYNYVYPDKTSVGTDLQILLTKAQDLKLGLFVCDNKIAPWDWRKLTAIQKRYVGRSCIN
jgi:endonuclease YncB( thermonuclease family)